MHALSVTLPFTTISSSRCRSTVRMALGRSLLNACHPVSMPWSSDDSRLFEGTCLPVCAIALPDGRCQVRQYVGRRTLGQQAGNANTQRSRSVRIPDKPPVLHLLEMFPAPPPSLLRAIPCILRRTYVCLRSMWASSPPSTSIALLNSEAAADNVAMPLAFKQPERRLQLQLVGLPHGAATHASRSRNTASLLSCWKRWADARSLDSFPPALLPSLSHPPSPRCVLTPIITFSCFFSNVPRCLRSRTLGAKRYIGTRKGHRRVPSTNTLFGAVQFSLPAQSL